MLTNATYQGLSLRTSQTQGVVTTTRQYESSRPLVTNISYNGLTGTQMQWERSGNLHSRRSYDGESSSYRYDGVNRLQGVDYPTGNVNLARENSYVYSYDDNGNPLSFEHDFGKMTHSYTTGNQVQQTTHSLREAKKYGYDFRGNRSWEKVWTDSVAMLQDVEDDMWQQEKIYTWNPEDELVGYKIRKRVGNGLDSMEYRYHYDENHRKVYAEKRVSDVAEWQPVREYVWDGVQVVYEKDLQRGEKTYFAVDGVEHVAEMRVGNDGTKKVLYRLNDHLGGLERLVDAQGKVVGSYRFEPYGKLERYAGSEQSRYAWGAGGKEWVEELGWYEFGRRKYDAQLGGWVSRDPKEQFASMYATGANPLNSVDVDGEAEFLPLPPWVKAAISAPNAFRNMYNAQFETYRRGGSDLQAFAVGFSVYMVSMVAPMVSLNPMPDVLSTALINAMTSSFTESVIQSSKGEYNAFNIGYEFSRGFSSGFIAGSSYSAINWLSSLRFYGYTVEGISLIGSEFGGYIGDNIVPNPKVNAINQSDDK